MLGSAGSELPREVRVLRHRNGRRDGAPATQRRESDAHRRGETYREHDMEESGRHETSVWRVAVPVHVRIRVHARVRARGLVRLQPSPREHFFRPSIDALFKSAAATYGRRVIDVLLSGAHGTDGPPGLWQAPPSCFASMRTGSMPSVAGLRSSKQLVDGRDGDAPVAGLGEP